MLPSISRTATRRIGAPDLSTGPVTQEVGRGFEIVRESSNLISGNQLKEEEIS
jgi:hypothetical protein